MLTFKELWDNHPTITGEDDPCATNGKKHFPNQCAIRVGVALTACGVDTTKIPGVRHCWQHDKSAGHVLAAEELAKGLTNYTIPGLGRVRKVDSENFTKELSGRTGIIFFKDYWQREGEAFANRSGDHIDLWNGARLTNWFAWANFQIENIFISRPGYKRSKEIYFWEVN